MLYYKLILLIDCFPVYFRRIKMVVMLYIFFLDANGILRLNLTRVFCKIASVT